MKRPMTSDGPGQFTVRGMDGCVITPAPVAREVAAIVRQGMADRSKRDGVTFRDATWQWLREVEAAAARYEQVRARVGAGVGGVDGTPLAPVKVEPVPTVSVSEAAKAFGTSKPAVQARIHRGAFPGAYTDARGHWRIPADAVQPKARGA
jgi:excisionase family DNA binding protein